MQEKQVQEYSEHLQQNYDIRVGKKNLASNYYDQYKQFFAQFGQDRFDHDLLSSSSFLSQLKKHKIKFSRKKFSPFSVKIISNTANYEIEDIELEWGYYRLRATIIKNAGESIFHKCPSSHGSLAKVYKIEDQKEPFVVKCISTKVQNFEDLFKLQKCALREYFIFRIAEAIGCGPLMKKSFGFDLLFSQDCIQFAMEYCSELKSMSQKVASWLKESLLTLHKAKIIHFDIKPDNIMWSSYLKKEVFVDFGLSQIFEGCPGFKYPVSFKGSLNYCSEQMCLLFAGQSQKSLDVYYNDVNCLKETILAFQNNFIIQTLKASSHLQQQQWIVEYLDEDMMSFNQISENRKTTLRFQLKTILLKYFIYIKNIEDIDEIYKTDQKGFLFSGEIINFTKNICPTNHFKEFYQRYITNSIKDSVQHGWIAVWAKSVYSKMSQIQIQNPEQKRFFISLSQSLGSLSNRISKKSIDNLTKSELQTILFRKDIEDLQLYFYYLISYISFINNYYQVNAQEKMIVAEEITEILMPQFAKNKQKRITISFVEKLFEFLQEIFRYILCYYARGQYKSNITTLDHINRLQLILDIFQHVFFFSLFSTHEAVDLLNKIYSLNLWSQQHRLQIIIRVNNDNEWNVISLFTEDSISHLAIQNWVYEIVRDFKKQKLNPEVQTIFGAFQYRSDRNDLYLLDYQPFYSFSTSLKINFWLQKLLNELFNNRRFVIVKVMKFIEDNFHQAQRRRLYFIYLYIFSIFISHYSNRQESWSVCQLFKNHLRCDQLFNRLVFLRILKMQKDTCAKQKIKQLASIVKLIKYENTGFIMTIFSNELKAILILTSQISNKELFNQFGVLKLVQNLKQVLLRINFKMKPQTLLTRRCENQKHIYYYFTLQFSIHFLLRQPYCAFSNDIDQLKSTIQAEKCWVCQSNMYFQFLQLKIQESIYVRPQTVAQDLIQLCKAYEDFQDILGYQQISRQVCYVDRVLKTYNSITYKLIHLNFVDQRVLKIMYKIYQFCKQRNIIERYFQCRTIPNVMPYSLKAISQFGGFEQLADLLRDILYFIRYTENIFSISTICNDFQIFLKTYLFQKPQLFINIMKFLEDQEKRQPYIASFYYAYISSTQNNSDRYIYIIKIFNLIQFMPLKMLSFFQSSLYCFILYKDHSLLQMIINKNAQQQLSSIDHFKGRRVKQIERMLIKLVHNIENTPYNRKRSSKRLIRAKQTLLEKCRNVGSYLIPGYANQALYLKPVFY